MVMRVTELGGLIGDSMSTVKRASFLLTLYIFSMLAVAAPAAAQNPTPKIRALIAKPSPIDIA